MITPKNGLLIPLGIFIFLITSFNFLHAQSTVEYTVKVTDRVGIALYILPSSIAGIKLNGGAKKIQLPASVSQLQVSDIIFSSEEYQIEEVELNRNEKEIIIVVTPFFQEWDGRLLTDERALPIPNAVIQIPAFPTIAQVTTDAKGDFKLKVPSTIQLTPTTKITVNGFEQPRKAVKLLTSSRLIIIRISAQQTNAGIVAYEAKQIKVINTEGQLVGNTRIILQEEPYFTDEAGVAIAKVPTNGKLELSVFNHEIISIGSDSDKNTILVKVKPLNNLREEVPQAQLAPLVTEMDVDIGEVIKELEVQKDLIAEQNIKLKAQIERISDKLNSETDLDPEQRATLQQLLYNFQRRLYQNEKAFDEAQLENQLLIEQMQLILKGQDSTNISLQKQNLEERKENARLAAQNEEFRTLLLLLTSGVVLLAVLAFIFYLVAKRDRLQRTKISEQADDLRVLNHRILKQNEAITDSLRYAQTIQMAMLPDVEKMKNVFSDFFMIYKPKDIVSGDFYWFAESGSKKFIAAVDCTGHGVPGAFMSMIGSTLLTRIVKQMKIQDSVEILNTLNNEIIHALRQEDKVNDDGMDVCLCAIEKGEGDQLTVSFTGAKRPLFYLEQGAKSLNMKRGDVKSIGGLRNREKTFTKVEIHLKKGDTLFLSSDGLVDQHNAKKTKFGTKKLMSFLEENGTLPLKDLGKKLEKELKEHQENVFQRDDITFLGVRI